MLWGLDRSEQVRNTETGTIYKSCKLNFKCHSSITISKIHKDIYLKR